MNAVMLEASDLPAAAQAEMDNKTKPPGSLGLLEEVAIRLATLQGNLNPRVDPARIMIFGGDHGVAADNVSAFPSEVTAQMMANFAHGGAAVCVLAKQGGACVEVIDVGVKADLSDLDGLVHAKVQAGTANLRVEAALSNESLDAALQVGREAMVRAKGDGMVCVGLGEMGIGNTTSAAVLTGALVSADAATVTGAGTGVAGEALAHKRLVVDEAMKRIQAFEGDTMEILRQAGGLEIAALVGAMLEAPAQKMIVIVDGYIVTAAALVACQLKPATRDYLFFAHRSAEPGHQLALDALRAEPLLDLGMRLGEGSATALALPLMRAACHIMSDMATFESAGVAGGD